MSALSGPVEALPKPVDVLALASACTAVGTAMGTAKGSVYEASLLSAGRGRFLAEFPALTPLTLASSRDVVDDAFAAVSACAPTPCESQFSLVEECC